MSAPAPTAEDRAEFLAHCATRYMEAPYYSSGRTWADYAPAYGYGYDSYEVFRQRRFEAVESELRRYWPHMRGDSRLGWAEARPAIREAWRWLDTGMPGHVQRDTGTIGH